METKMELKLRLKLVPVFMFIILLCLSENISAFVIKADTLEQVDSSVVKIDSAQIVRDSIFKNIAGDFANRLKSQLNLTDEQTVKSQSILSVNIEQHLSDDSLTNSINDELIVILDERQRSSWQIIRNAFWNDLNRRIKDDMKQFEKN